MNDIVKASETQSILANLKSKLKTDLKDDQHYARGTIIDAIEKQRELAEYALDLARESEHPRAMEVAGNIMNAIVDSSLKLADLHNSVQDSVEKHQDTSSYGENTGMTMSLTTADLLTLVDKAREEALPKDVLDPDKDT